jgi:hypothetical protein
MPQKKQVDVDEDMVEGGLLDVEISVIDNDF